MRYILTCAVALCCAAAILPVAAETRIRDGDPAGSVISRRSGEEVRFIDVSDWRFVDVDQDLLPGDVLRTNAIGQLAILFADRTQLRLGRNSELLVKQVGAGADAVLGLQGGSIWARAQRGGTGLTIETPAASAAIRGTDWTMTVDASGRTSLTVLEGLVELSNAFGSVSVAEGEAAVAAIGQAPSKLVIVDPDDRAQMLFHVTLRDAFVWMPAAPVPTAAMRAERDRIAAIPEAGRTAADWLALAENALRLDGMAAARAAADRARGMALDPSEQARLDLLDALAAAAAQRYAEAAALFARAAPRLDPVRRGVAVHGGYFARALADPQRVEQPPPTAPGPFGILMEAWATGFLTDIPAAIAVIRRGERLYPDDPTLPAFRAQFATLIDDRAQVREAYDRALALDPEEPTALMARARYRGDIESDLDAALADLEAAARIMPGSSSAWNAIGLVLGERGAVREAEEAFRRAIALDPYDPVPRANVAILYLDADRPDLAGPQIDAAMAIDPALDLMLIARGRHRMQVGEVDAGLDDILAGTTANPAYAQGLLLLAAAYHERGERDAAEQALENADRLDPNDPAAASLATSIAIDGYDSDRAIASAQEALRRARARGGDYGALSANRDEGSLLNNAFRLQGLDAWGRYYGDATFNPFVGAGYVDQLVSGVSDPFVGALRPGSDPLVPAASEDALSSLFQGLLLSPEMLSSRSLTPNLFSRPFVEGAVGAGFIDTRAGTGRSAEIELQGFTNAPFPVNFLARFEGMEADDPRQRIDPAADVPFNGFTLGQENLSGFAYATARPTLQDRLVAYVNVGDRRDSYDDGVKLSSVPGRSLLEAYRSEAESYAAGIGWSHSFGHENVLNAAVFTTGTERRNAQDTLLVDASVPAYPGNSAVAVQDGRSHVAAVGHSVGIGDLALRWGVEGGWTEETHRATSQDFVVDPATGIPSYDVPTSGEQSVSSRFARGYVDALYTISPSLQAEAALFGVAFDGGLEDTALAPRVGVAFAPAGGHWLRAAWRRDVATGSLATLAPVAVVGLQPNAAPIGAGGHVDTFAARWEAEWTRRFFTVVDYQHQRYDGLSIAVPGTLDAIDAGDGFATGRVDRLSATANLHLGHGFGIFATAAWADSANTTPGGPAGALPLVPELSGRAGITFVHPSNLKLTLSATYVGERSGGASGVRLDDYWTADAALVWEPFDKRFELELAGYNLFDEDFDVAAGAFGTGVTPGWGRTIVGSLKVRF
jgi:tetratricopeptide (TPR) repeat protein